MYDWRLCVQCSLFYADDIVLLSSSKSVNFYVLTSVVVFLK
jgi:hypothetical protein